VGLDVDPETMRTVHRGRVLREALRQDRLSARTVGEQVLMLCAVDEGWLGDQGPAEVRQLLSRSVERARLEAADTMEGLDSGQLTTGWKEALHRCVSRALEEVA
jgi:F-type H+-transporting ATPase subunit alpha